MSRYSPEKRRSRNKQVERARARKKNVELLREHGKLYLRVVALAEDQDGDGLEAHAIVGVLTLCGRGTSHMPELHSGLEVSCDLCLEIIDVICEAYE